MTQIRLAFSILSKISQNKTRDEIVEELSKEYLEFNEKEFEMFVAQTK